MLDLDHLRTWIGRSETAGEPLTPSLAQRFNATFDQVTDTDIGAPAPLMIHLCLAPQTVPTAELAEDGHAALGGFLPPVPLSHRMWAGGTLEFIDEIRIGDHVCRHSTIREVTVKEGRSGLLCFVTVDHLITAEGREVLRERQDIVYRGATGGGDAGKVAAPAPSGEHYRVVTPLATLLFRYSALTFNAHRIHYDAPHTRAEDGYPGLIVHGPMQATMLVQFASKLRGQAPVQFEFRSVSPLFDDGDFSLNAVEEDDGLRLWTAYAAGGPVAMDARATW